MALAGILEYLIGKPADDRAPMLVEFTGNVGQRDRERERREREELARQQRRKQAQLVAQREPLPPALRLTPEEQALTAEDNAYLANVEAARQEIARDNALIDAGLPPFAVRPGFDQADLPEYTDYNTVMGVRPTPKAPAPATVAAPSTIAATPSAGGPQDAPLDEEGQKLQGLLQNMGAFDQTGKAGGLNQAVAAQDPGLLSQLGRGVIDYFSDPINRKTLAIGMAGLSSQPNRGYQAALQGQIEQIQQQRATQRSGNQTADYLESRGLVAEADLVRANPALAADILSGATGGSNYQKELEKIVAQDDRDLVNEATKQQANREKTLSTLQTLDSDEAFLGALSPIQTGVGRVLQSLGVDATDEGALGEFLQKSSNTELLRAQLGRTVFEAIGELGIGARGLDTPAERKFLIEVMAGTPESTRAFLRGLLQDRLRSQEITIEEYNKALKEGRLDRFQQYAKRGLSPIELEPYGDEFAEFEIVN